MKSELNEHLPVSENQETGPNWRHVGIFLVLNFGLTYLLDLVYYLRGGLSMAGIVAALQMQMLLPAFVRQRFLRRWAPYGLRQQGSRGRGGVLYKKPGFPKLWCHC